MKGVLDATIKIYVQGQIQSWPLASLMVSSTLLKVFELVVSSPKVIRYLDYKVLCDLAQIPYPADKIRVALVWDSFMWHDISDLPPELVQLREWIDSGRCAQKYQMALRVHEIVRHNTLIPKSLECFFIPEMDVNALTKSVYETFFYLNKDYFGGICEFTFLCMVKGYVTRMDMGMIQSNDLLTVDIQTKAKKFRFYDYCIDMYYAIIRFATSPTYRGRFLGSATSPSWVTKKRHRDIFYTPKELWKFFVEKSKIIPVKNEHVKRICKHFFWRVVLDSVRDVLPSFIQFTEDPLVPEYKGPSV
jgi:hypothetical protein